MVKANAEGWKTRARSISILVGAVPSLLAGGRARGTGPYQGTPGKNSDRGHWNDHAIESVLERESNGELDRYYKAENPAGGQKE